MDSIARTERMERIGTPPLQNLKLKDSSQYLRQKYSSTTGKPSSRTHSEESNLPSVSSPSFESPTAAHLPLLTSSPYREGFQARDVKNTSLSSPMSRTQSMPNYYMTSHEELFSSHPNLSPKAPANRVRFPRKPIDEVFVCQSNRSNQSFSGISNVVMKDQAASKDSDVNILPTARNSNSFPRFRRPISPHLALQQMHSSNTLPPSCPSTIFPYSLNSSRQSDQYLVAANYCYSGSLSYPGSHSSYSIPSTPTSARSRSSSISSLETIPDSPDAEEAALEEDRLASSKIDPDTSEICDESKIRFTRDVISGRGRMTGLSFNRDKRKRWSVCGAERRGDFNLGTIWEDQGAVKDDK